MGINETSDWLERINHNLPIIGAVLSGALGMLATIIGYFRLRKLRLHKIETAIGKHVLSGERRLATVQIMEECKEDIVHLIKVQDDGFQEHVRNEDVVFERIEEKINHTHDRIDEIFKLLAAGKR